MASDKRYLLAQDTIDHHDLEELAGWLVTNPWLTQGKLTQQFQEQWAQWIGVKFAVFVNSGSSANLLMYAALQASGKMCSPKVILPAVAWSTSVAPALQLGFEPVLCDAELTTLGLDLNRLESLLKTHRPAAVLLVHVLGVPNDMAGLIALQRKYEFDLLEDACAATGSRYDDRLVGGFGKLSSFSFYFGHHLSTIEGGMVCTNDPALHDLLLMLRSHGWAKDLAPAAETELATRWEVEQFNRPFTFYEAGFNVRSTDLNAKIGLGQLRKKEHVVRRRAENHRLYQRCLGKVPGLLVQANPRATISSISFAALASSAGARSQIVRALHNANIETRPLGGGNMSRQPFWARHFGSEDFPVADRVHQTAFQLPNHPGLKADDINFICDTVEGALEHT